MAHLEKVLVVFLSYLGRKPNAYFDFELSVVAEEVFQFLRKSPGSNTFCV
jgi:hypothetical protein